MKAVATNEVRAAVMTHKKAFWAVGGFSALINLLYLVPSIYMLQIYDRVLASRSETTLVMISLIVFALFVLMGLTEWIRSKVLVRLGNQLDLQLAPRIFTAAFERNLRMRLNANAGQVMNDFTTVRQFVTGNGVFAFFDAPWAPIYVIVVWMFHPLLGIIALLGMIAMGVLAWINEVVSRKPLAESNAAAQMGSQFATSSLRNAEAIESMGMLQVLLARWNVMQRTLLSKQSEASDKAGLVSAFTKALRLTLQSSALGVGGYLVIQDQLTPGMMIAASILTGRALAPIDLIIATWKPFVSARGAYQRLVDLLAQFPARKAGMSLPRPNGVLTVEQAIVVPPGAQTAVLKGVSLQANPGEILTIVGPSASGKSTLARVLVGVWGAQQGKVRLDGADIYTWNKDELGPWLGYLPQDVELFNGTIAENIARFGNVDSDAVIAAATKAGMHDMILRMPQGYDTPIGDGGAALSGGQRQRVGLARALYGSPAVVVLDEPNANLDDVGERALLNAMVQLRQEGVTVVLITHRTSVISVTDRLLVMRDGAVALFGPRQAVLDALAQQNAQAQQQAQAQAAVPAPTAG